MGLWLSADRKRGQVVYGGLDIPLTKSTINNFSSCKHIQISVLCHFAVIVLVAVLWYVLERERCCKQNA